MAQRGVGLHEVRTRVICHLSVNNEREERPFFKVLGYIRQQRQAAVGVQGYTHSVPRPAVFLGYWWSDTLGDWLGDEISLVIIDYQLPFSDRTISLKVKELKKAIRRCYRHYGSPQEEVWVVAQQIIRQD